MPAPTPPTGFESVRLHCLGEELDRQLIERQDEGESGPTRVERQIFYDKTQTIINHVAPTSDVPFDWTLNPYRGCEHGCIYCFARQYHEYLGFSCGLDFETKLMAKPDAPNLLKKELANPRWKPEPIVMSAITDIYQPLEHKMQIARQCLQVLADCGQPVATMTKSSLVLRDTDLWQKLAANNAGRVTITLVTLDPDLAQKLEPRASPPSRRLAAIRELAAAGIRLRQHRPHHPRPHRLRTPQTLEAVAEAGARRVACPSSDSPPDQRPFLDWLKRSVHPDRARKVESLLRQSRHGKPLRGSQTASTAATAPSPTTSPNLRHLHPKILLNRDIRPLSSAHFRPPTTNNQLPLF